MAQQQRFSTVITSPVGVIGIYTDDTAVKYVTYLAPSYAELAPLNHLAEECASQLQQYFADSSWYFDLPLMPDGTAFQRRVWQHLSGIQSGQTQTYGHIARRLHTSARAIGNACRQNPLVIVIPCHRVISSNGVGGYSGSTYGQKIAVKQFLLDHENAKFCS